MKVLFAAVLCVVMMQAVGEPTLEELVAEGRRIGAPFQTTPFRAPLLVLPGLGGSVLDATFDAAHDPPHWYCTGKQDAHLLWLRVTELVPKVSNCFFYNIGLEYDVETNVYSNKPGVSITPRGFGNFSGTTCLDPDKGFCNITPYLVKLKAAYAAAGYVPGLNVRSAPYDFRLGPDAEGQIAYFARVQELIEQMFVDSGGEKVHLMGHSMGAAMGYQLMAMSSPVWKEKYIASFIPLGGPLGGAPGIPATLVSGRNFAIPYFNATLFDPSKFAHAIQAWGGVVWMSPNAHAAFSTPCLIKDEVTGTCYGIDNMQQFYLDSGANVTATLFQHLSALDLGGTAPGVPVHCGIGHNVSTPIAYVYSDGVGKGQPEALTSLDGDGTVPGPSLRVCASWVQDQPLSVTTFQNVEHGSMPSVPVVLEWLLNITTSA